MVKKTLLPFVLLSGNHKQIKGKIDKFKNEDYKTHVLFTDKIFGYNLDFIDSVILTSNMSIRCVDRMKRSKPLYVWHAY